MSAELLPIEMLSNIATYRGVLWEKIEQFEELLKQQEGAVEHEAGTSQSAQMQETFPLRQHIEGGLYTRELFMPQGSVVVSMIHKQAHPSFLLKGKVSYLTDEGEVKTIVGPHRIFTQIGTQRVFYVHEDTEWCCVYRTDAKTFEEAEADVYTSNYRYLPAEVLNKRIELWQELEQVG